MYEYSVDVDETAGLLKKLFIQYRNGLFPGSPGVGPKFDKVFEEAARKCLALGEVPEVFVRQRLELAAGAHMAWPQCLLKELPKKSVKDEARTTLTQAGTYRSQLVLFSALCRIMDPRLVVADLGSPFTPLFRYAMAKAVHHDEYADMIAESAKVELAARPFAKDVFGDLLKNLYGPV